MRWDQQVWTNSQVGRKMGSWPSKTRRKGWKNEYGGNMKDIVVEIRTRSKYEIQLEKATNVDARGPDSTRPSRSKPTPRSSSLRNDILNFIVDRADAAGSFAMCSPIPWKSVVHLRARHGLPFMRRSVLSSCSQDPLEKVVLLVVICTREAHALCTISDSFPFCGTSEGVHRLGEDFPRILFRILCKTTDSQCEAVMKNVTFVDWHCATETFGAVVSSSCPRQSCKTWSRHQGSRYGIQIFADVSITNCKRSSLHLGKDRFKQGEEVKGRGKVVENSWSMRSWPSLPTFVNDVSLLS